MEHKDGFTVEDKRGREGDNVADTRARVEEHLKSQVEANKKPDEGEKKADYIPTYIEQLLAADILGPWIAAGMFPQYYKLDPTTGHVVNSEMGHPDVNIPWIMVNNDGTRVCDFYKHTAILYGFIPKPCRACWKVVVMPNTLKELLVLLKIERQMVAENPYCFCKCGIESRKDVERNYGGYFYCNSLEEGLIRLEDVRGRVRKEMGEDVRVILKRGCTEFERQFGPSSNWDALTKPHHERTWNRLCDVFRLEKAHNRQPEVLFPHIILQWVEYAGSIKDPTVKELNGGKNLYPGYVTYEQGEAGTAIAVKP